MQDSRDFEVGPVGKWRLRLIFDLFSTQTDV